MKLIFVVALVLALSVQIASVTSSSVNRKPKPTKCEPLICTQIYCENPIPTVQANGCRKYFTAKPFFVALHRNKLVEMITGGVVPTLPSAAEATPSAIISSAALGRVGTTPPVIISLSDYCVVA